MSYTPPLPLADGRTRYVYQRWLRKPDGPLLTKPPPAGVRSPNELIWGHNLEDFCWIERIPNVPIMTIWSRTMIKEYGENYDESEFQEPDATQVPRMRHPWPVLKVPNDGVRVPKDSWGVIDQGCVAHARPDYVPKRRDEPEADDASAQLKADEIKIAAIIKKLLRYDDENDIFVLNDPLYPLRSVDDNIYALLFKSQIRHLFFGGERSKLPPATIQLPQFTSFKAIDGELAMIQLDEYGVEVMGDHVGKYAGLCKPIEKDSSVADSTARGAEVDVEKLSQQIQEQLQVDHAQEEAVEPPAPEPPAEEFVKETASVSAKDNEDASRSVDTISTELDHLPSGEEIPHDSPFSTADIPKLEEDIPEYYFPDILYVHDPHKVTTTDHHSYRGASRTEFPPKAPMVYKRVYPKLARDDARDHDLPTSPPREAHLHLAHQNRIGVGNHSLVHDATLTLPAPLSAHSRRGTVRVAAKSAFPRASARNLLANEGRMYSLFPAHLRQDWCGLNFVTPVRHPVPVGPVVPRFYGYYAPTMCGTPCAAADVRAPSPLLLIEHCGDDVVPSRFTPDERSECYSLMLRLHYAGFTQGSFYVRNILRQDGPLSAPPAQRSPKTPSFRVIDFGRGEEWKSFIRSKADEDRFERKKREWTNLVDDEDRRAQRELQIPDRDY